MKRRSWKLVAGAAAAVAISSVALLARAWQIQSPFEATINGHEFHEVKVWNEGCTLKVKLRFRAPKDGYSSGASVRNYHRFKARLEMGGNITVDSLVFGNRAPGNRAYVFDKNTEPGGCWAKNKLKLHDVDIEGCRGKGCRVAPFDKGD